MFSQDTLRNKEQAEKENLLRLIRKLQIVLTIGGIIATLGALVAGRNTAHRAQLDQSMEKFYEVQQLTSIHLHCLLTYSLKLSQEDAARGYNSVGEWIYLSINALILYYAWSPAGGGKK